MKGTKVSIIGLVMIGMCLSSAWAAESAWKKIGESAGITGYTRSTTKSSIDEMKGMGIVDAPLAVVEAVIRDTPNQTQYMYKCKEAGFVNTPELKSTTDIVYTYNVTGMPFPVKDRDAVAKALYTIDKATGTVYIHAEAINTPCKQDKKRVRMPLVTADYTLVPKGADKTEVTYQALADPGGFLPAVLVNQLTKNIPIKTIEGIRQMSKKDKYKNAKTVVTTTPH